MKSEYYNQCCCYYYNEPHVNINTCCRDVMSASILWKPEPSTAVSLDIYHTLYILSISPQNTLSILSISPQNTLCIFSISRQAIAFMSFCKDCIWKPLNNDFKKLSIIQRFTPLSRKYWLNIVQLTIYHNYANAFHIHNSINNML